MAVQYSKQSVVSDGTLSTIVLGIKYILRSNIYLRVDGVETPQTGAPSGYTWSFLDATTIRVLPVVPTGITVEVYRRTDITGMYNVFSQNAQFDEGTIDENNTQLLYIAQEYLEQDLTGVGIASLEYVRSEPGYEIYRFQRSDGTYFPEFPVPTDTAALETHKLSTNQHPISGVTGLDEALKNAGGNPVLSVAWVQLRTAMWNGYVAADGQLLKRADYPDAWEAIEAGKVPVCTDADWLADPAKRGCFTLGDGSTTFRVPDYNGKSEGSLGAMFQRGDGLNSAGVNGEVQGDAIRNITGTLAVGSGTGITTNAAPYTTGAFAQGGRNHGNTLTLVSGAAKDLLFDASNVVPTSQENRPVNVTGCWAIKLFGAVQNAGSIDAMGLATQVANLDSNKLDKTSVVAPMANGGVIERGSNANGEFVRFADGTQICSSGALQSSSVAAVVWDFPAQFIDAPSVPAQWGYVGSAALTYTLFDTSTTSVSFEARLASNNARIAGGYMRPVAFGRWK